MGQQDRIVDLILQRIDEAKMQYHRLVLLVGIAGSGKTSALQAVRSRIDASFHNVGVELSKNMLELPGRERATGVVRLLSEVVNSQQSDVVLLDNTETLFHPALQANPLDLLKTLSRTRIVVASWPGQVEGNHLIYAKSGHPEHERYDIGELLIVEIGA